MQQLVSIILPVYNGESTITESIESLLSQSYSNFELIVIDDGSIDGSLRKIQSFSDKRIKVYSNDNVGLAKTLNFGLSVATGELIARQDQDDISLPSRIEKQVNRFNSNSKLVLLGTNGILVGQDGEFIRKLSFPNNNNDLQFLTNFYNPFLHTSVMMRADIVKKINGYSVDSNCQPPEDFELWNRIKYMGEIENLEGHLVKYRILKNSMSNEWKNIIENNYRKIVIKNLQNLFDFTKNDADLFFELQLIPSNKINLFTKINIFLKYFKKITIFWVKPNTFGIYSYRYTVKMLAKTILK